MLRLLDHRHRLASQDALVDKHFSFEEDSFEWHPDGSVEKDDVSRDHLERGHFADAVVPEDLQRHFVERHLMDLLVDSSDFYDGHDHAQDGADCDDHTVVVVLYF